MKKVAQFTACLALSMVVSASVMAQGPMQGGGRAGRGAAGADRQGAMMGRMGMGMGMGMNPIFMLASPQMSEELKLTEDQVTKIQEIMQAAREEMQPAERPDMQNMTREEMQAWREKREAEMQKQMAAVEKKVMPILNEEQTARFKQIALQQKSTQEILTDAKIATALELSVQQKSDIAKLVKDFEAAQEKVRTQFGPDVDQAARQEAMQQFREMRQGYEENLLGVLTDAQKEKLEKMKGEPFEMMRRRPAMRGEAEGDAPRPAAGNRGGAGAGARGARGGAPRGGAR
jgi:hypothetical protein